MYRPYRSSYHPFRRPRFWYDYLFWVFFAVAIALGIYEFRHSREWAQQKLDREGFAQGFRGRDPRGEQREGYVCSNLLYSYIVD
jgi:hypothetical protein